LLIKEYNQYTDHIHRFSCRTDFKC